MSEAMEDLIDALEQVVRTRASRFGWTPEASPGLVRETSTQVGVDGLVQALSPERAEATHTRLPELRRGLELQPGSLGVLMCGLDETKPDESYRSALWWTGLVRSEMPPARRSDLHLFLVAPKGTSDEPRWHARRSEIESDERFCRKFVWLPSGTPGTQEIGAFLDRTFLAQPWTGQAAEPRSLDPLERLVAEASTKNLNEEETRRWIARLGTADSIQQIAEDLVAILEGKE